MASTDRLENGRNEDAPFYRDRWSWEESDAQEPADKEPKVVPHPLHLMSVAVGRSRRRRYWEL